MSLAVRPPRPDWWRPVRKVALCRTCYSGQGDLRSGSSELAPIAFRPAAGEKVVPKRPLNWRRSSRRLERDAELNVEIEVRFRPHSRALSNLLEHRITPTICAEVE